jgi:hypothetical protein
VGRRSLVAIGKNKARIVSIVPEATKEAIQKLAEKEARSESSMTARLLKIGLEHYEQDRENK